MFGKVLRLYLKGLLFKNSCSENDFERFQPRVMMSRKFLREKVSDVLKNLPQGSDLSSSLLNFSKNLIKALKGHSKLTDL